jgi:hypothetical protein
VLFGQSSAEWAHPTGAPERTLYRHVAPFETQGSFSLFGPSPVKHQQLHPDIWEAICELRAEHLGLRTSEITTCLERFVHRPNSHSVNQILAETPLQFRSTRRFPPYAAINIQDQLPV